MQRSYICVFGAIFALDCLAGSAKLKSSAARYDGFCRFCVNTQ
ncbi:MAG: hypothetical protein ACOX8U_11600 [Bradymonadia bacterium]